MSQSSDLIESQTQFIDLFSDNNDDESDIKFITKLIKLKSDRINYNIGKGKSDVWKVFEKVLIDNKETSFVKCNKCEKLLKYNSKSGNSTLIRHKENCKQNVNQLTLTNMFKDYSTYKTKLADSAAICSSVDLLPFSFIEGKGFNLLANDLIKIGKPNTQFIDINKLLPNAKTVSNHINSMYEKFKKILITELELIEYYGLTCDHWVHDITKNNYLTLTIQYFKNNSLKERVLFTKEVNDKKAMTTKDNIKEILIEFGLKYKSYIMVTDNAKAMQSAFSDIL
jgi:hypothetical protein